MPAPWSAAAAAVPILLLLGLLLGLRWSTARAAAATLLVTLAIALGLFDLGAADEPGRARVIAGVLAEAASAALSIAWILWPALAIHRLQRGREGGPGPVDRLQQAIRRVSGEPAIVALLVAWFFALFLEGAAGFGTPVALAAPLLVSAGFQPITALSLALLGHAVGVQFGAIGTPLFAIESVSGLEPLPLSRAAAIYLGALGWMIPLAMLHLLRRAAAAEDRGGPVGPTRLGWAALAAALYLAPCVAVAWWIGPELPSLVGGLAGGLLFALLWQRLARAPGAGATAADPPGGRSLLVAAAPYLWLVVLVLVTRLVPMVRDAVAATWSWSLPGGFEGRVQPVRHPGTLLLASLLLGAAVQRARPREIAAALGAAARRLGPVLVALIAVLAVSRLMVHAGMIDELAAAAVAGAGPIWPLVAPLVGVLGTFVTGSATASNLLFTDFQLAAAAGTDLAVPRALGAQSFGAATGNMIAPMNVLAGAATVGLVGREGEVLRRTTPICLGFALAGGLLTWLLQMI